MSKHRVFKEPVDFISTSMETVVRQYLDANKVPVPLFKEGRHRNGFNESGLMILITIGSSTYYFNIIDEVFSNKEVMEAEEWKILYGFKKSLFATLEYFYGLKFKDDYVIDEKKSYISDL